jgi:hypothetical protein
MINNFKHSVLFLFSVSLLAMLAGCATLEKKIPGVGSIFTESKGSAVVEGVYYSGSSDLPLHKSPGGAIVKRLPQHTKLHRDKLVGGFAHVRVDSTGETGWVENAKLIWRLPQQKSATPAMTEMPAASPPQPAIQTPESPAPTPVTPSPAATSPSSEPAKPSVAPSIFNPY